MRYNWHYFLLGSYRLRVDVRVQGLGYRPDQAEFEDDSDKLPGKCRFKRFDRLGPGDLGRFCLGFVDV